jgi:uncharacterized protein DUF4326
MIKPERIQLKREKGWRLPPDTVKVDRSTRFGNPFSADKFGRESAVEMHRIWLTGQMSRTDIEANYPPLLAKHLLHRRDGVLLSVASLRGRNLACWCSLEGPCHATFLLELANRTESRR